LTINPGNTAKVLKLVRCAVEIQSYMEESLASLGCPPFRVEWVVPIGGWDSLPDKATLQITTAKGTLFQEFTADEIKTFTGATSGGVTTRLIALAKTASEVLWSP
jgi:hypothetical protein